MTLQLKVVPDETTQPTTDLSDDDLMFLSAIDRKDAFEILVTRHHAFVFGLAARFLGDRQAGRDIAQDVFLSVWAERDNYQRRGRFKSYLAGVCLNRCRVAVRSMKNQDRKNKCLEAETTQSGRNVVEVPLDALLRSERDREIRARLSSLPGTTKAVLIYRYTHDMSLSDIGDVTGMPLGTVKSHLCRGLLRLRRMLTKGN